MTNKILEDKLKPNIEEHPSIINIKKRSGKVKYIVVHCSASQNRDDYDWKSIDQVHRNRGFICIGYHFVIKKDGTIQNGRPLDAIGAHAKGYNDCSIGICLVGGINKEGQPVPNFTDEQYVSLRNLVTWLQYKYWEDHPKVLGHRDLPDVHKDCPCFDVKAWYRNLPYEIHEVTKDDVAALDGVLRVSGEAPYKEGDLILQKK